MFDTLIELVIALCDLLEAEGRSLRIGAARLLMSVVAMVAALVIVMAGLTLILWSFYLLVEPHGGASLALSLTGVLCFVIGAILVWGMVRLVR